MPGGQIMVVEDEGIIAMDIQNRLEMLGYSVPSTVSSGERAIKQAEEIRPDLVLMDIVLKGGMDGIEAGERIRKQLDIPILYLTAYADDARLERARISDPFGYILKPFLERELYAAIEMALHRHKLERELRNSKQWLETILKSIGDAVIATDRNGVVSFMNSMAERLTGYGRDEAVGRPLNGVYKVADQATKATIEDRLLDALEGGVPFSLSGEALLLDRQQRAVSIEESATPIMDEKGDIWGGVIIFRDITWRKHLEEQLRQAQKMEAVGTLAGGIAHDFNNLLTAIIGYSQIALSKLEGDRLRLELEEILKAGKRASSLTAQLLTFSRRQILQPRVVDLNEVVTGTTDLLRRLIGEDIELVTRLDKGLGRIKADPGQMEQVIMNLVVNARDAIRDGGKLILETSNVALDGQIARSLSSAKHDRYVMLAVTDNGEGMAPETQSRIFEPFFTTKPQGTGLGLSTVYGIVKQSGGDVYVHSEVGKGTTFKIYLPGIEAREDRTLAIEEVPQLLRGDETILIVEDDVQVRSFSAQVLRGLGYAVLEAGNGEEALELARQLKDGRIDLLLTDVVMPQMSGRLLADMMRAGRPGMKVLFTSGYNDNRSHNEPEAGKDFLQKPFTLPSLARKVRSLLDGGTRRQPPR